MTDDKNWVPIPGTGVQENETPQSIAELLSNLRIDIGFLRLRLESNGDSPSDGRYVHRNWDDLGFLNWEGKLPTSHPAQPPAPDGGWSIEREIVALDKLRKWLESQAAPSQNQRSKKVDAQTEQSEAELAAEWQRAREQGIVKADFARDKGMKQKELNQLLDRVRHRKSRSGN